MELTISQVKEAITTLPNEEKRQILDWLSNQEHSQKPDQNQARLDRERYKKTDVWLRENRGKYLNQWVCLDGDNLISHGLDGLEVHRKAKEQGIKAPFLEFIVDDNTPFGGW